MLGAQLCMGQASDEFEAAVTTVQRLTESMSQAFLGKL
jgi:hypothetical protein